ncbi:MAG: DUF1385 domain-containing protein [Aminobacteriaceae bacterium]|uniref:DUF1385 domain-containing protein n=1 Tax=Aminivibrio sp. TaxID=1872489 RepID=UPI002A1C27CE|nr:DUF1385 domain-containing protein [Synergistaceae bacterium]MDD3390317.1 DUF1385 domain-containing protein [Synergistaceae bacterium]MDD4611827.1 DUF1385 domain-containing protein [Synergistaceae bacterium]
MKKILMQLFLLLAEGAEDRRIPVGGQAVIEGVLMKGPAQWGLSVRKPDGMIETETWSNRPWTSAMPWKLPVIRGVVTMIEMMTVGFRALDRSAQIAVGEEEKITAKEMFITAAVAILAVVGLFIALPLWLSDLAVRAWGIGPLGKNILEGCARGIVFIAYVAGIGMWSEIRRVFSYHGAEHKTINAYEAGAEMTVAGIRNYSRIHPRCGTSFLLIVVAVSIVVFSLAGHGSILWRIGSRIVLLPLVMGISYEIIRGASCAGALGRVLMAPAMSFQYITTREPDESQIEVALASLEAALGKKLGPASEAAE